MAIDNQFGKGIGLAAGFDLGAQKPLDARIAVNTVAERDAHVTENRAYEGMIVYVAEDNMTYQLVKGEEEGQLVWKEFGFNKADFDANFEAAVAEINNSIANHAGRIEDIEEFLNEENAESGISKVNKAIAANAAAIAQEVADRGQAVQDLKSDLEEQLEAHANAADAKFQTLNEETLPNMQDALEEAIGAVDDKAVKNAENIANHEGRIAANETFVAAQPGVDSVQDGRIKALEDDKPNKEAAINKNAQDIAKVAEDLAKEVEDRGNAVQDVLDGIAEDKIAQAAVDQEQDGRLDAVEGRLDALDGNGKRVALVEGRVGALETAKDNHESRIAANEAFVDAQPAIDQEQDRRLGLLEEANAEGGAVANAIKAAQDAADQAQEEVDALEGVVEALDTAYKAADGALDKRVQDLETFKTEAETAHGEMEQGIADNKAAIEQEVEDREAAITKEVADREAAVLGEKNRAEGQEALIRSEFAAADGVALQAAKDYADQQITALVDSAPDAMNTLNELAGAINANKGVYDAYVEQHAQAMADMKKDLQDEIDDDVAAEAALRKQADNALGGRIDTLDAAYKAADTTLDGKITKEAQDRAAAVKEVADELAKQKDADQEGTLANKIAANAQAIADEASRADAKEKAIEEALANAIEKEVDDRGVAIKVETDRAVAKENEIAQAVLTEKGRAEGQEAAIRGEMAAEATRVNEKIANDIAAEAALRVQEDGKLQTAINGLNERMEAAEGDIDALEAFQGQQETKNTELDAEDERIAGLVASEVTNRENAVKAVADDLANNYSNTVEVKAIIAAVVNSLAIELTNDDKLLLKLGGTDDAIVLKEVSLNIANDADIQAIIDGLDDAE